MRSEQRRKPALPAPRRTRPARRSLLAGRAKKVWLSLLASMTLVGGGLLLIDVHPAPRTDGLSLPPLVASDAGTADSIESIFRTRVPLSTQRWTGIVVHHSGSPIGSPASIEAEHEAMNFAGLGHHFLIGNGSGMEDGGLHVGYRWLDQLPGAHASGPAGEMHNLHSVSICLIGNGDRRPFTTAQTRQLVQLVAALCHELNIPQDHVYLHRDIVQTSDPGVLFPESEFRRELAQVR